MIGQQFADMVDESIQGTVEAANGEAAQARVLAVLDGWLLVTARKKQSAELLTQLATFRKRLEVLAANAKVTYLSGKLVVIATGDAETTLRMLVRGTEWFDPCDDVEDMIAGAILN